MTHCGRFSLWTDTSAGLAAADDEDGGVDLGRRAEGAPGHGCAHADPEAAGAAGRVLARRGALEPQVGGDQPGGRRSDWGVRCSVLWWHGCGALRVRCGIVCLW